MPNTGGGDYQRHKSAPCAGDVCTVLSDFLVACFVENRLEALFEVCSFGNGGYCLVAERVDKGKCPHVRIPLQTQRYVTRDGTPVARCSRWGKSASGARNLHKSDGRFHWSGLAQYRWRIARLESNRASRVLRLESFGRARRDALQFRNQCYG